LISTSITRISGILQLLGGLVLLFVPDVMLPRLIPGFPAGGAWLGQLLAAAWLGFAALNWLSQSALLGGIYGRAVVVGNATFYFVAALSLFKVITRQGVPPAFWLVFIPVAALACVYSWLMFRGPVERDLQTFRARSASRET